VQYIQRCDTDKTHTTVAYTAIVGSLLITLPMPFIWKTPENGTQLILIITMSLMAAVAEVLVIRALEVAEAVVVAPIHYTLIIWGTMYGYVVFGHFPDTWNCMYR